VHVPSWPGVCFSSHRQGARDCIRKHHTSTCACASHAPFGAAVVDARCPSLMLFEVMAVILRAWRRMGWLSADSALGVSSSEVQAPYRARSKATQEDQGQQDSPDPFPSLQTRSAWYTVEPRTKGAFLGEAVLRQTQGSDNTSSPLPEPHMCACTLIGHQSFDIPTHGRCLRTCFADTGRSAISNSASRVDNAQFPGRHLDTKIEAPIQDASVPPRQG
jgi:hypothetical protein